MLNKNTRIKVKNRSTGPVVYTLPDMNNLHRKFYAGEVKDLPFEELQKLSYKPGGMYILENYLIIENKEAIDELLGKVELEYNYNENEIKDLLTKGSLDELLDCLDFAPAGVIDLLKKIAVEIEISDLRKRQAIFDKTGLNITKAIEIKDANKEETTAEAPATGRRVATPESAPEAPVRRMVTKK